MISVRNRLRDAQIKQGHTGGRNVRGLGGGYMRAGPSMVEMGMQRGGPARGVWRR